MAIGGRLTVRFVPRPAGRCLRVLGVTISQAPAKEPLSFSVPAHVLATLNVVLNGTLTHHQRDLPRTFATGCHTRSRRYTLSPGSVLLSLVFKAWPLQFSQLAHAIDPLAVANSMLDCVAPCHLPPLASTVEPETRPATRLRTALRALVDHPSGIVAKKLHMSERGLQRLFLSQWGINPKRVQRMLRIQRAVALWGVRPCGLADLAAQTGLVDQAHLAREFRELVGYPPSILKLSPDPASEVRTTDVLWALRSGGTLLPLLMQ